MRRPSAQPIHGSSYVGRLVVAHRYRLAAGAAATVKIDQQHGVA